MKKEAERKGRNNLREKDKARKLEINLIRIKLETSNKNMKSLGKELVQLNTLKFSDNDNEDSTDEDEDRI